MFPFLALPRECRDKIYKLLLIPSIPAAEHDEMACLLSDHSPACDQKRKNVLDTYEQAIGVCPSDSRTTGFIRESRGLLFVNKQVHEEASQCLFGENLFTVVLDDEALRTFWNYEPELLSPSFIPTMSREDFARIKYLNIYVENRSSLQSPTITQRSNIVQQNLAFLVDALVQCDNRLKYLHVRYSSCFGGQLEEARDVLEHPTTGYVPFIIMVDWNIGKPQLVTREQVDRLFEHSWVLDPLELLSGRVDNLRVRGDIRLGYIYRLEQAIYGNRSGRIAHPHPRKVFAAANVERGITTRKSKQPHPKEWQCCSRYIRAMAAKNSHNEEFASMAHDVELNPCFGMKALIELTHTRPGARSRINMRGDSESSSTYHEDLWAFGLQ